MTAADRAVLWIWIAWRDKGGKLPRPPEVQEYIKKHGKIPASWWARYAVHKGKKVVIPPKPPTDIYEYVIMTGWDPAAAMAFSKRWTIALSADPGYRDKITPSLVAAFKEKGHAVVSWADCRVPPDGTPATEAIKLKDQLKLDGWIGQGETVPEAQQALANGCTQMVGNAAEIWGSNRDLFNQINEMVHKGLLRFWQECYWGDSTGPPSTVSAMGIPARLCLGVYSATRRLAAYFIDSPALRTQPFWIYLAEGMDENDIKALPV